MNRRAFLAGLAAGAVLGKWPGLAKSEPSDDWVVNHVSILDDDIWCHSGRGLLRRNKVATIPIPAGHMLYRMNYGSADASDGAVNLRLAKGKQTFLEMAMNAGLDFAWQAAICQEIVGADRLEVRLVTGTSAYIGAFATTRKL